MHAKNSQAINTNCGVKLRLTCEEDCVYDNRSLAEYIHRKRNEENTNKNKLTKKIKEERKQTETYRKNETISENVCKVFYSR